jgi:hypothetical protein
VDEVDYNWRGLQAEYLEALLDEDWFIVRLFLYSMS